MVAVNNTNISKANEKYICLLREHMMQWGIGAKGLNLLFLFPLITDVLWKTIAVFPKCFTEFRWIQPQKYMLLQ